MRELKHICESFNFEERIGMGIVCKVLVRRVSTEFKVGQMGRTLRVNEPWSVVCQFLGEHACGALKAGGAAGWRGLRAMN
jgi:hypothetical protein